MGYQALLFCPDEKLARVVSQVFSELDFTIDPVAEPFAAVKKLMAQHYDAVVVDCDNDQNSSLLLKSARTSTLNQGSLAIAMVEGQAGVARAYRIGANLVLTKPINLEQTKGTLRVARGLLRKNSDAAAAAGAAPSPIPAAAVPAPPALVPPAPVAPPVETVNRIHQVVAGTSLHGQSPEFGNTLPTVAASAKPEPKPAPVPAPVAQKVVAPAPLPASPAPREGAKSPVTTTSAPAQAPAPVVSAPSSPQGAASAPAPAKEIVAPVRKVTEKEKTDALPEMESAAQTTGASTGTARTFDGPSFAALDDDNAGGSGSKKILIAAAVILAVAVTGYLGWTKFGQSHSTPAPQAASTVPQTLRRPVAVPNTEPASAPAPAPSSSTSASSRTTATPTTSASRTSPIVATTTPKTSPMPSVQQPAAPSSSSSSSTLLQNEAKTAASSPIVVKSGNSTKQEQPEASPSQLPSPLAMASPSDNRVGGILSSASSSVARPSLVTLKVSQGVSQGLVIKRVQPKYPANALAAHIQGVVQIEATVNKEGKVVNPKVLSGEPTLAAAALDAVKQWRYKPYYLDGEPVEIQTQITINFKAN